MGVVRHRSVIQVKRIVCLEIMRRRGEGEVQMCIVGGGERMYIIARIAAVIATLSTAVKEVVVIVVAHHGGLGTIAGIGTNLGFVERQHGRTLRSVLR